MSKEKTSFISDFKKFITKGNVIDMAVGVVIGGSFGKIVTGLVNYIINPFIGIFLKSGSFDSVKTVIIPAVLDEAGAVVTPEAAILWGTWLQTVIDFFITALCIFIVLRIIIKVKNTLEAKQLKEEEEKTAAEAARKAAEEKAAAERVKELEDRQLALEKSVNNGEKLLCEIRDIMKSKK